ncbi:MAG: DUF2149 domain-containing protein [Eggerthellaceae bacterium]|nr:DUF2149 domain-containing protein [Eggerthellaceae bacterium]MBR2805097.1 DUF2149 domain-containing protein [Eggerthellaceae bacterium]
MSSYYGSSGSFRPARQVEEVDPMSSLGNIGDIMLVFACGLMVALVVAWNVDLGKFTQVQMDQEIQQDEIEQITEELYGEGNAFVEKGTVYQDPVTGKYYLVEDEARSSSSGSSGQNGSSGENS